MIIPFSSTLTKVLFYQRSEVQSPFMIISLSSTLTKDLFSLPYQRSEVHETFFFLLPLSLHSTIPQRPVILFSIHTNLQISKSYNIFFFLSPCLHVNDSKKCENFVNRNKIIFGCLYIALWPSYNMNSDLLDGSKKWENFVNGNKIIFGCLYTGLWSS